MQWKRAVLDQCAGATAPTAMPESGAMELTSCPFARSTSTSAGPDGGAGNSGRQTFLHDPRGVPAGPGCNHEQCHGDDLQDQRSEDHRLAPKMVGNQSRQPAGAEQRERIDREDDRDQDRGNGEILLIDPIERRRCCRRAEKVASVTAWKRMGFGLLYGSRGRRTYKPLKAKSLR